MIYLFSDTGLRSLNSFIDGRVLFVFDLDGTLAPIVAKPSGAVVSDEVRAALINLNGLAPVAVISGRARADAHNILKFMPAFLVGNHGAEGLAAMEDKKGNYVDQSRAWLSQLKTYLPDAGRLGIFIEDKGASISLHYRNAVDQESARIKIIAAISKLAPPPRRISGKCVENVVPPDAPNKGTALEHVMSSTGCAKALFAGDDETDEDVFRLKNPMLFKIRVGRDEGSAAAYYLSDAGEVSKLLHTVIEAIERIKHVPEP